jgi:hypothetical protein
MCSSVCICRGRRGRSESMGKEYSSEVATQEPDIAEYQFFSSRGHPLRGKIGKAKKPPRRAGRLLFSVNVLNSKSASNNSGQTQHPCSQQRQRPRFWNRRCYLSDGDIRRLLDLVAVCLL